MQGLDTAGTTTQTHMLKDSRLAQYQPTQFPTSEEVQMEGIGVGYGQPAILAALRPTVAGHHPTWPSTCAGQHPLLYLSYTCLRPDESLLIQIPLRMETWSRDVKNRNVNRLHGYHP